MPMERCSGSFARERRGRGALHIASRWWADGLRTSRAHVGAVSAARRVAPRPRWITTRIATALDERPPRNGHPPPVREGGGALLVDQCHAWVSRLGCGALAL